MRGSRSRRGRSSWRLKVDLERGADGKRQTRYVTVRGSRKDADAELARILHEVNAGVSVNPSKITVGQFLHDWLTGLRGLTPGSAETYRIYIVSTLSLSLAPSPEKLRPAHVKAMVDLIRTRRRQVRLQDPQGSIAGGGRRRARSAKCRRVHKAAHCRNA